MSGIALGIAGLDKSFGGEAALAGIDLAVAESELLVVLGPTGAGKTTLLRCIAGLETPDAGSIRLGQAEITAWPPARRDVALVFQNFSLYPSWTVRRNLAFPLRAPGRRLPAATIAERIAWAARLLRIEPLLDRKATQLSGGEMQRVAIGRAIVRTPRLFLLDEPLTNLDAKLREALRLELVALQRELATPMVFVTHDQAEALSMGDRIVVLAEGRIQQIGRPEEVYERPANTTVARQLGQPHMNLVGGTVHAGRFVDDAGRDWAACADAEACCLGFRPEHLQLAGGGEAGRIVVVEDMGPTWTVVLDWRGHHLHAVVDKGGLRPRLDDEVRPLVDEAAWRFFRS